MQGKIINLFERKLIKESQDLFGINKALLESKSLYWQDVKGDSFCTKKITGEAFYIPKDYNRNDDEIEVVNYEGNMMYIGIAALMPYPQLYEDIKMIFANEPEKKHRIIPPNWDGTSFDAVKEKKGILTLNSEDNKIIIVFEDNITWETNVTYKKSLECFELEDY